MKSQKQFSMDGWNVQTLTALQLKQIKGGNDNSTNADGMNFIGTTDIIQL